jgi:hypothetical protein
MLGCRGIDYMVAHEPHHLDHLGVRILGVRRLVGPGMFADPLCPWQRRPLLLAHCRLLVTAQPTSRRAPVRLRCTKSMLWPSDMYLLQGERSFVKMTQEYARARSFRAKDALICLQHIVCAEKYVWIPPVLVFASVVANDLHPQSSRFNLTVVSVLVRLLCRRR